MAGDQDNSKTSISLIDRARADSPEAWRQLTEIYSPLVHGWAKRGGLRHQDADDIVQNVFHLVSKNLGTFRKETAADTFRGWLWTITRNEVRGWYRNQTKSQDIARGGSDAIRQLAAVPDWVTDEESTEEIEVDPDSENQVIRRAADLIRQDFQEHTWTAFWRSAVEGHPTDEIAADLKMKSGAIRQAKLRVLKRFREVLDG